MVSNHAEDSEGKAPSKASTDDSSRVIPIFDLDGDENEEDKRQDTESFWENDWYSFPVGQDEQNEVDAQIAEELDPRPEPRRDPIIDNAPSRSCCSS